MTEIPAATRPTRNDSAIRLLDKLLRNDPAFSEVAIVHRDETTGIWGVTYRGNGYSVVISETQ